ncbi:MAG: glycosyltransferase family 2 protein [Steroidobacteraceae bacterium]
MIEWKFDGPSVDEGGNNCEPGVTGQPIVTIVTAVFNGAKTLRSAMSSVISQLGDDAEYIVIDGGSKDGTVEIIKKFSSRLAYWVSESDRGIYDAWNKGVLASRGRYIAFVGADDVLESGALEAYKKLVARRPDLEYVSSRVAFGKRDGRIIGRAWRWSEYRRYMTAAHVGSLHRRDLYERYGLYDVNYRIAGDYEFLMRVGAALKAGFLDQVTVVMGAEGVSSSQVRRALAEARMAKVATGACGSLTAGFDFVVAHLKARVRALL